MLRKLRRKFIFITMSLISAVLLLVFAALMISSYQQNRQETISAMQRAMQQTAPSSSGLMGSQLPEIGGGPGRDGPAGQKLGFTPTVTVTVSPDGEIQTEGSHLATIAPDNLSAAVATAQASGQAAGILSDFNLRYLLQQQEDGGYRIVFADRSQEISNLRRLLFSSLLIGAIGLIAFFLMSLALSRLALRPVEKAWDQQRQFVADASHELKTPLTVILANTGILLSHPQQTIREQQKWVDSTKTEGERMKKLIDELLFLAKNDAERRPPELNRLELSDTVWSCLLPFEALAYERGVSLEAQIEDGLQIQGSAESLKQLILVLLDNACKYSGCQGAITVTLKKQQDTACLTVHNMGEPIPPEALPHVFERFYRTDASRARTEGGYGLGLAIAQTIASQHRAKLTAASSLAEGTTFTLSLPLCREE